MSQEQSFTWELLLILGIIVVLISFLGKFLGGLVQEITTHHDVELNWNPFSGPSGWNPWTGQMLPEQVARQMPGGPDFIRRAPDGSIHIGPDFAAPIQPH